MPRLENNEFGRYLRDRRERLDPSAFGFSPLRRRTPGLRREEVAQRAGVSANWYTWLEQGHGGIPSADVLDRIAAALALTSAEREHLFLLAQSRPPRVLYDAAPEAGARLQQVLDALGLHPAYLKTLAWDVLAWNTAAEAVLTGFADPLPGRRNILRTLFCDPRAREEMANWEEQARFAVSAFRADAARAVGSEALESLLAELQAASDPFRELWKDRQVRSYGLSTKRLRNPHVGLLTLNHSAFWADGRPDLSLVVYTPAAVEDRARLEQLAGLRAPAAV